MGQLHEKLLSHYIQQPKSRSAEFHTLPTSIRLRRSSIPSSELDPQVHRRSRDRTELPDWDVLLSAEERLRQMWKTETQPHPVPDRGRLHLCRTPVTATSCSRAAETVATACHTVRSQCVPTCPCLLYRETQAVEIGSALHRPFPVFLDPWVEPQGP